MRQISNQKNPQTEVCATSECFSLIPMVLVQFTAPIDILCSARSFRGTRQRMALRGTEYVRSSDWRDGGCLRGAMRSNLFARGAAGLSGIDATGPRPEV